MSGTARFVTWSVLIMTLLTVAKSQSKEPNVCMQTITLTNNAVIPSSYITIDAQTVSVRESSATGHCSSVSSTGVISTCTDPTSSVLFDGVIPTLTGLDGDMWASQLLTLQTTGTRARVLFDFTGKSDYNGAISGRLEMVMFNCPEMGISAATISISTSASPSVNPAPLMVANVGITSCDSLVRVCIPIATVQPSISLDFVISVTSDMVYLAEVTFYAASSASTCPPDTIITTAPPDTIITTAPPDTIITTAPSDTIITTAPPDTIITTAPPDTIITTAPPDTIITTAPPDTITTAAPPDTIITPTSVVLITTKLNQEMTTTNTTAITITSVIVPVVVVICVVFMIVGIMAAVLILWRYHKHKTSHHTALGEGQSHAHTHSHPPPVKMCEETGQVCYSSPPEALGQLNPSHDTYSHLQRDATHEGEEIGEYSTLSYGNKPQVLRGGVSQPSLDTYSHLQRDTSKGRGGAQPHQYQGIREYSALSHGNSPHVLGGGGEDSASHPSHDTYSHLQRDSRGAHQGIGEYSALSHVNSPHGGGEDSASQLYAQIDKKTIAKKKVTATEMSTLVTYSSLDKERNGVHSSEADTAVDLLYAQVDKKMNNPQHTPGADTPADILGADSAVDHFYAVLEDNRRKRKDEVATNFHTPQADSTVDHFYAVLEDNREEKKGEVADTAVDHFYAVLENNREKKGTHPHSPEAGTAVDHFYAVLEDNRERKKGEVAIYTHPHMPDDITKKK